MEVIFQYFPARVDTNTPLGAVTLEQFIEITRNPKPKIKQVLADIAQASKDGDEERKTTLKQENLYYFVFPVILSQGRSYSNIHKFTGLMGAEFDKVDYAEDLRDYIFETFPSCVVAWMTPSRKGCKFIFKIPECNTVQEYKEYYFGLSTALGEFQGFDDSYQNCVLPTFISYDPNIRSRDYETASTWTTRGYKEGAFDISKVDTNLINSVEPTNQDQVRIKDFISSRLINIEENGHGNVIRTAKVAGGYCAAGYFEEDEMWSILDEAIHNSPYLSKSVQLYLSTAERYFYEGMQAPLILK